MNRVARMVWMASFFMVGAVFAGTRQEACFYLDKSKLKSGLTTVVLSSSKKSESLRLESSGLINNKERVCRWSLNGGSGTKETFSLDGEFAVPILDPACEKPFSHEETGVGFGDWYLAICGTVIGKNLVVESNGRTYSIPLSVLTQWTKYEPGNFPIEGDSD